MSVILDALKKAQDERERTAKNLPYNPRKKSQKLRWLIYSVASFVFCILVVFLLVPEPRKTAKPLGMENKGVYVQPPGSPPVTPEKTPPVVQPGDSVNTFAVTQSNKKGAETDFVNHPKGQRKIALPQTKRGLDITQPPATVNQQDIAQPDGPNVRITSIDREKVALKKFNEAIKETEKGNIYGAKLLYQSILAEQPSNIEVLNNLGVLAMKEGNTKEALFYFNTVLQYNTNYGKAYNNIGLLMLKDGQKRLAEEYFRKSIELGKDGIDPSLNLAALLREEKRYEEAARLLEGFIATNVKNKSLYLSYALIKDDVGHYEEAVKYYRLYLREPGGSGERREVTERIKVLENTKSLQHR